MAPQPLLPDLLARAGAVMASRPGPSVPVHYGSAAAELAVCVRDVGLALRSDLATLSLVGRPDALDAVVERAVGHRIACGGATRDGGAWWCRAAGGAEVVVLCRHRDVGRLRDALRREAQHVPGVVFADRTGEQIVLHVVGRRTDAVLRALGVFGPEGDWRDVSPFVEHPTGGSIVRWLLETRTSALAIAAAPRAADAWRHIDAAGHRSGLRYVGLEALTRYALFTRNDRRAATTIA